MLLLMQYLRNGLVVVAKNRKCRLNKIKVVIFQLIMKMPIEAPTMAAPAGLTEPRYSGARKRESAPNDFIKPLATTLNKRYQKIRSTWNFFRCRNTS